MGASASTTSSALPPRTFPTTGSTAAGTATTTAVLTTATVERVAAAASTSQNLRTATAASPPSAMAAVGNDTVNRTSARAADGAAEAATAMALAMKTRECLNPAADVNARLDTQVEIKVYPCNNSNGKKKGTQFMVKPEGVIIQGTNRPPHNDIGTEYARHIGRKLPRYELSDTRASQLLITSHAKSFYVIPAPEAFSRHSGTCRLLGDRKHAPTLHTLRMGDFLRVGSVGVVVIETHDGVEHNVMSEDRIQRIMQDTTLGGYVDMMDGETDVDEASDAEGSGPGAASGAGKALVKILPRPENNLSMDVPTCYMCFDETDEDDNPLICPCKCKGDTQYVHVDCLRKWHTAEADNQICFLSTLEATCSVCKSTFKSDFRLRNGKLVKLFQSTLEPPYVSLLIATKHEMAQRLFNTRFQLSFSTLMKPDGKNAARPLMLGRSSASDMMLDYRTVSARHATIKFKNGEFIFSDAGSSNGSYLYVRQPVELSPNHGVQFRLGRSMISMKVVNKWNKRLLRAVVRRSGASVNSSSSNTLSSFISGIGNHSQDSTNADSRAGQSSNLTSSGDRKLTSRESIIRSMPPLGQLDQQSPQHLDLIYALAIPKREQVSLRRGLSNGAASGDSRIQESSSEEKVDVAETLTPDGTAGVSLLEESPSSPQIVMSSSAGHDDVANDGYHGHIDDIYSDVEEFGLPIDEEKESFVEQHDSIDDVHSPMSLARSVSKEEDQDKQEGETEIFVTQMNQMSL